MKYCLIVFLSLSSLNCFAGDRAREVFGSNPSILTGTFADGSRCEVKISKSDGDYKVDLTPVPGDSEASYGYSDEGEDREFKRPKILTSGYSTELVMVWGGWITSSFERRSTWTIRIRYDSSSKRIKSYSAVETEKDRVLTEGVCTIQ